jgi:subtilisin family serine protease
LRAEQVLGVKRALRAQFGNAQLAKQIGLDRYFRIELPPGSDVPRIVAQLAAFDSRFESVQLDGIGGIAAVPNDPSFSSQWNMHNTGQVGGTVDEDVDGPETWDLYQGSETVTVAIIDSGVQADHPDLLGRVLPGWNTNDTPPNANSADLHGHGTHVAGIIGATGDNGFGVAGMNWNCNLLPVRCVNGSGLGTELMAADAITWATDNGAHIISMSLQYYTGTDALRDAVIYAVGQGKLLIAATGNFQAIGTVAYPARFADVMGVAASNRSGGIYSGSNSGAQVDVCAPGQDVFSLWRNSGFNTVSGTSMATPHVSGLASLIMSRSPSLGVAEIESLITSTAIDHGAASWDPQFGWGVINARRALYLARPFPGDVNLDERVNVDDLLSTINAWGDCPLAAPCPADSNLSGFVDVDDLLTVINNWTPVPGENP